MDAERHAQISKLFLEACDLRPEERDVFLENACQGDAQLRAEIDSLLAHDKPASTFLDSTAMGKQARAALEQGLVASEPSDRHPDRVGAYEILHVLGEGGQGIVYAARQQTPRRAVALKVLRGGGFARARDVRHFQHEIQALAALRHPGIAAIHEAGRTDEGQHFLAMELVEGVPIDAYVRAEQLKLPQQLELFCKVCDAVQHAHEKGIIHRDLKPKNILVEEESNPKILDFGLVRITNVDITRVSTELGTGPIMGSLRYMSPEQARGKTQEMGAWTDVYSLGVMLYELLTGQEPYEVGDSVPEAISAICEKAPRRPGTLNRALRGDLETIIFKALEKEPVRRYQSVEELAGDIRRHLRREPIRARRPSAVYLLGRKVSRHPVGWSLAAAALLLGVAGSIYAYWIKQQSLNAARMAACDIQQRLEVWPAERVLGEAESLYVMHPHLPDAWLVWAQAQFKAGRQLDKPTLEGEGLMTMRDGIEKYPSQWAFRALLGEMYRMKGHPDAVQLMAGAENDAPDTASAWYLRSLATLDVDKANDHARRAVALNPRNPLFVSRLAHLCGRTGEFDCALRAADIMIELGNAFVWTKFQGDILTVQGEYLRALEKYDSLATVDPVQAQSWDVSIARALAYLCSGDYVRAVEVYTDCIEGKDPRQALWHHYMRATPLWILGRMEEAAVDYRVFIHVHGQALHAGARLYLVLHDQASLLEQQGWPAAAEEARSQATRDLQAAQAGVVSGSWFAKIYDCMAGDRTPEELIEAANPANSEQVSESYYYAAEAHRLKGEHEQARKWFRRCVDTGLMFDPDQYPPNPMAEYHLARWRLRQYETVGGG